jgi:hypothetical protein
MKHKIPKYFNYATLLKGLPMIISHYNFILNSDEEVRTFISCLVFFAFISNLLISNLIVSIVLSTLFMLSPNKLV